MTAREAERRIEAYVEAVRALRGYRQAEKDDGPSPSRTVAIAGAKLVLARAEGALTGGLVFAARRRLDNPP